MVNVAEAEPFDGTATDGADHVVVNSGIFCTFNTAGVTTPAKPSTLVNVTL